MNLSQAIPIYDITKSGIIIGDVNGNLTVCFRLHLPKVFSLGENDFQNIIENFRIFLELLGDDILVHKQDFYYRRFFSMINRSEDLSEDTGRVRDFLERAYQAHFNERPYLSMESYMYITKINSSSKGIQDSLVSKKYASINENEFLQNVINGVEILKKNGIQVDFLNREDLLSKESVISRYYNFSDANIEQLKDVSFEGGKVYVGSTQVHIYTIESLEQFPVENIGYNKIKNGLPVSNMYPFSFPLSVPHVVNQYLYIPNQIEEGQQLENHKKSLESWNFREANKAGLEDTIAFTIAVKELSCKMAYFHYNIMAFDETRDTIDKHVNIAFGESTFKKKENILSRKDLFLAGIPGNGARLVTQKKNIMSLLIDIEGLAFFNWEQNYDNLSSEGIRLCDRIYGIPFTVDLFNEPMRKGFINNKNSTVMAGSGSGKSFYVNLMLLNMYLQGGHMFCVDASYSYLLQCKYLHKGVYLNFDEKNRISFNPFYMEWLKEPGAKIFFKEKTLEQIKLSEKEEETNETRYSDLLQEKINTIQGIITAVTKSDNENASRLEESIYRKIIYQYFRDCCINDKVDEMKFDSFYEFTKTHIHSVLKEYNIDKTVFDPYSFLLMLEEFKTGNTLGYLLNAMDDKIRNLEKERFVVIDVSRIKGNRILFDVVCILSMDLYNQKVARLPQNVVKALVIDEAWQAFSSPRMAFFAKEQVKVIRKYGGQTIFISQELGDFISSEIIRDSIINNSAIKIFLEMGEYKQKFEPIKKELSVSDSNALKILSLNQNNRQGAKYKEVCISWGQKAEVYAVEVPFELKAIFETNPDELAVIIPDIEKNGIELASINYANSERKM
jgi:conserved protein found in conjugate transposon